jgi:hypothetical protein
MLTFEGHMRLSAAADDARAYGNSDKQQKIEAKNRANNHDVKNIYI